MTRLEIRHGQSDLIWPTSVVKATIFKNFHHRIWIGPRWTLFGYNCDDRCGATSIGIECFFSRDSVFYGRASVLEKWRAVRRHGNHVSVFFSVAGAAPTHGRKKKGDRGEPWTNRKWRGVKAVGLRGFPRRAREPRNYRPVNRNEGSRFSPSE